MELPYEIRERVEGMLEGIPARTLRETYTRLSERYRGETGQGKRLLSEETEAAVYAAARMPATFGAVSSALKWTLELLPKAAFATALDVGAGTGTAGIAIRESFPGIALTCLERESAMRTVGTKLLPEADWREADLTRDTELPHADLVCASYVVGEMTERDRMRTVRRLWDATDRLLLLIEPGTPVAHRQMLALRDMLLAGGAHMVAPCPHVNDCRLPEDDWCHFTCRVPRSRLHKELKGGDVPYEDEKFTYMAFMREPVTVEGARVLRHPDIGKGQIRLRVCTPTENAERILRKRDGDLYRQARKSAAGDLLRGMDTE